MSAARLNWSTLKELAISPARLRWRVENPRPDTPAMRLGRAIDCLVLEPDRFAERWITPGPCGATKKSGEPCENPGVLVDTDLHWYCRVRGHAPDGTVEYGGAGVLGSFEVLSEDELAQARRVAQAVRDHRGAMELIEGAAVQQELEWTDPSGLLCRGRVDLISRTVTDLKTTCKETPAGFEREIASRLYHGQLAWYYDGAILAGRIPQDAPPPRIISVSTGELPDVTRWRLPEPYLSAGRCVYRELLERYMSCEAAGWWPGHSPDERDVRLRDYDPGMRGIGGDADGR